MSEGMNLVRDLAVILISAGLFTIISKALKQPLILGYIVAGFLVGPNIDFFPGVSSAEAVNEWSEIGIIFLMFGLGLEFSFKKLLKVGSSALVTAATKFAGVFVLGFVIGMAMGWSSMECIFLAGLLSMSSTMVVIKSYDEMGLKDRPFAGMVFGTLVVEDLIAIMLMVLFSTIAVSNSFSGAEMMMNLCKLAFFIILWFLIGIYAIPTILAKAKKYISDEILLLVSIGLCFGMVTFAEAVGFSSALGAFVMGSILAETMESEHIEHLVSPIKDLFGAIFFVSVGMMLSPSVIAQHWLTILILTVTVILSHILFAGAGILMAGKGLKNAVFTGFSLAQLGEFGFILAGVGVTLGVMRDFIYPVIIAVSVITTFTTPYVIKLAGPVYSALAKRLPASVLDKLEHEDKKSKAEQNQWKLLLRTLSLRVVLYSVVLIAVTIAGSHFLNPLAERLFSSWSDLALNSICAGITILVMVPFLYGLGVSNGGLDTIEKSLLKQARWNIWPIIGLAILRATITTAFAVNVLMHYFHLPVALMVLVAILVFAIVMIGRNYFNSYSFVESKFMDNLNKRELHQRKAAPVATSIRESFEDEGYDVHLERIPVGQDSALAGKTIRECQFRKLTGANVIKLQRGPKSYVIPSADTMIFPHDVILAVGTKEQTRLLKELVANMDTDTPNEVNEEFGVCTFDIPETSIFNGKTVQDLKMRQAHCMVVSVSRNDNLVTNPGPDYVFKAGDKIWLAGEVGSCQWYMNN